MFYVFDLDYLKILTNCMSSYWMISKRALIFISTAWSTVPTQPALRLERVLGTSKINIGETSQLTIEVDFPVGTTTNVVIDISSSYEETVLAFVKVVNAILGSNIKLGKEKAFVLNNPDVYPGKEYVHASNVRYNTRAVIDLGIVSNTGADKNLTASQIFITYEVVMVSDAGLGTGTEYWTSVGMFCYFRNDNALVSQISYSLNKTIKGVPGDTKIQCKVIDAPSNLKLGEKSTFRFHMKIPNPKFTLRVEAEWLNTTHQDNYCLKLKIADAGESFKHFLILKNIVAENFICPLSPFLALEIPNLINKESTVSGSDETSDTISVEATIQNTFDVAMLGTQLFFGIKAKIDNKEICVSQFAIVVDPPSWKPLSGAIFAKAHGNDSLSPGFPAMVMASVQTPPETGHVYEISVSTSTTSSKDPALSVLALSLIVHTANMPCSFLDFKAVDLSVFPSVPPTVTSKTFTFTLHNIGYFNDSTANTLNFSIVSLLMDRVDVVQNDRHLLTITAKSSGSTALEGATVTFTVGEKKAYQNSTTHKFQILSECKDNNYLQDTTISVKILVDTETGVVSGPMVFQLPIPQNNTTSKLYFHKAEVVNVGKNVICVCLGDSFELNVTAWDGSIDWKLGILTFPVICNVNLSNDPLANRFVLKVDIEIVGTEWDQNGSYSDYFGYSARYSKTQRWDGWLSIDVHQAQTLNEMAIITGILVNDSALVNVTWPDRYIVQYSADGIPFTDAPNLTDFWNTKCTRVNTNLEYFISVPIISKYVRLSTYPNKSGCWINNYFVTTPAASVLKIWGDVNDTLLFKMNKVFDRDTATCFVPPINGVDTHPPMLWLRMNLSIFNLTLGVPYNVKVIGENLVCYKQSSPKSMHVAHPHETKSSYNFNGYIRFCTLSGNESSTQCTFNCRCTNSVSCNETFLYMRNDGDTINPARLCELQVTLA
ncbi:hypothetical protein ACJMK2_028408 [Sinanodonta woodiana]|uniref:F5/8 type C domain-containing protein n=1 Tax=Sinanodonta woodiana TaxID=1069815 RepID=A0ABD3X7H5_SINWO